MTPEEAGKITLLLATAYPNSKEAKNPQTAALWQVMLEAYDYAALREAVLRWLSKNPYYPRPSDILVGFGEPTEERDPYALPPEQEAEYADKVRAQLRRFRTMPLEPETPAETERWRRYFAKLPCFDDVYRKEFDK